MWESFVKPRTEAATFGIRVLLNKITERFEKKSVSQAQREAWLSWKQAVQENVILNRTLGKLVDPIEKIGTVFSIFNEKSVAILDEGIEYVVRTAGFWIPELKAIPSKPIQKLGNATSEVFTKGFTLITKAERLSKAWILNKSRHIDPNIARAVEWILGIPPVHTLNREHAPQPAVQTS